MMPFSSFATELQGFRMTLLERDEENFLSALQIIFLFFLQENDL